MNDQSFKMSIFGGFSKKSVVDYISKIVDDYNLEADNLKKEYEKKLELKDEMIADLSKKLELCEEQVKSLSSDLDESRCDGGSENELNLKKIEEQEATIASLRDEIERLKKIKSDDLSDSGTDLEIRISKAKEAAKERVNQIIEQAREKISQEYKEKVEKADIEIKAMRSKTVKEASQVLNRAASVAQKIIMESKEKIKRFVEIAKHQAKEIVESANLIGRKIVTQSAESVFDERRRSVSERFNLNFDYFDSDVEAEDESKNKNIKIDDDLFGAVKKLNADALLAAESSVDVSESDVL